MTIKLALSSVFTCADESSVVSFPGLEDKVCSPFFGQRMLAFDAIEAQGLYWPFACLGTGNGGILFFLIRDDSRSIACWELDTEGDCISQTMQPFILVAKIFKTFITDEQITLIDHRCAKPFADSYAWVAARLNRLIHPDIPKDISLDISSFTVIDKNNPCMQLFHSNLFSINTDTKALRAWLQEHYIDLYPTISNTWHQLCGSLFSEPPQVMLPAFNQGKYCLFREVASIYIGRHIIKDPFGAGYLLSCNNRLVSREKKKGYYRIISYKTSNNIVLLEVRGLGFLMQTDCLFFSSGLAFFPSNAPSSWLKGERKVSNSFLNKALRQSFINAQNHGNNYTKASKVRILNNSHNINLGHFVWNDLNGICTFIQLLGQAITFDNIPIEIILSHEEKSIYSDGPSHHTVLNPIVCEFSEANAKSYIKILSINELLDSSNFDDDNVLHVSIKGWNISPKLASNVKSKLLLDPTAANCPAVNSFYHLNTKVKLFVNIRGHNKSFTNIDECLLALIGKLSMSIDPVVDLSICLEGSHHSTSHIDKIVNLLSSKTHDIITMIDQPITVLAKAISGCNLSIMPIGSGAVVSTWICSALTLLHGDHGHRVQKGFWTSVSGSASPVYFLPESIFTDETDQMYSSYSVDPELFADEAYSLLKRFVLT